MFAMDDYLERIWDGILSEDKELILQTYAELGEIDQKTVINHLKKMVNEDGWLPVQIQSANTALLVIQERYNL
jgi:hypothetical protein